MLVITSSGVAMRARVVVPLIVCLLGCGKSPTEPDAVGIVDGVPGGPGEPTIRFVSVPEYATSNDLTGIVLHVRPDAYQVAVFIRVDGAWWTKPSFATPVTAIGTDGSWVCDVTTGGIDHLATDIAAFLIPRDYRPPLASGLRDIPVDVQQKAVARATVSRTPRTRTISFSDHQWQVKTSGGVRVGPGPNYFSDDVRNVFVDTSGRLHMRITRQGSVWQCAEVVMTRPVGYGHYTFTLEGGFERMNENAVLGLFTWDAAAPEVNNREIDIEFSRWSVPGNQNGQFVIQPHARPGNIFRFEFFPASTSTHAFSWTREGVDFESSSGVGPATKWSYRGSSVPVEGNENVRINLWLFNGAPPSDGNDVEVIVRSFVFTP